MLELECLPAIQRDGESGSIPDYVRIYDILYKKILDGMMQAGDPFPSENAMARHFGVSRGTIRTAMRRLAEDGYVLRRQGKLSVLSTRVKGRRRSVDSLYNICIEDAVEPVTQIRIRAGRQEVIQLTSVHLDVPFGSELAAADLGYYRKEEKIAHTFITVRPSLLVRYGIRETDGAAMKEFFSKEIYHIGKWSRSSGCVSIAEEPTLRNVAPQTPVLAVEGVLYEENDRPLAYYKHHLNMERYRFQLERRARH